MSRGEFVQFVNTPVGLFIFSFTSCMVMRLFLFPGYFPSTLSQSFSVSLSHSLSLSLNFSTRLHSSIAICLFLASILSFFFFLNFHWICPWQFISLSFFLNYNVSLSLSSISDSSSSTLSLLLPPSVSSFLPSVYFTSTCLLSLSLSFSLSLSLSLSLSYDL